MQKLLILGALVATASFVACGPEEVEPPPPPPPPVEIDAGRDYDRDGGGALNLISAVNEDSAALSWRSVQEGEVAQWEILTEQADGIRVPIATVPGSQRSHTLTLAAGETQRVFVVGLGADEQIVFGELPEAAADAGVIECVNALQCEVAEVCSLNLCQTVSCTSDDVCPTGYTCGGGEDAGADVCTRAADYDAGTMVEEEDAGTAPAPVSLPFVSELIELTPAASSWSAPDVVTESAGLIEDSVALDTAGQLVLMRQSGQLFAHRTDSRGERWAPVRIDSLGTKPRLAFHRDTQTLFVCYGAGNVVRVRKSTDFGRTWEPTALDIGAIEPQDPDAGTVEMGPTIADCDIAPYTEGNVVVAAVESPGDEATIKLYTVSPDLEIASTDTAFISTGTIFNPRNIAIASDASARRIHVVFTGLRLDQNNLRDQEIYGVRRDPSTAGVFSVAELVSIRGTQGTGSQGVQDDATIAIDPVTGRAVAAYVSREFPAGRPSLWTIYGAMFTPNHAQGPRWVAGGDLNIFEQVPFTQNPAEPFIVVPQRTDPLENWYAFEPSFLVGPKDELILFFLAGPATGSTRFEPYAVGFDLNEPSPTTAGAVGWYLAPAEKLSEQRVHTQTFGDRLYGSFAATADRQISRYVFYTLETGSLSAPSPGGVREQHNP